jgi:predicted amidohydrolase
MRQLNNLDALFEQCEFFIDVVSGYGCDFALFPELFTAPLADYNHLSEAEATENWRGIQILFTNDLRN